MSEFTVHLIVLLLPGVVSALLVERLTVHPPWSHFRFVLYSILLGAGSYAILDVAYRIAARCIVEVDPKIHAWGALASADADVPSQEIIVACGIGALLGFLITLSVQRKWLHRLARRARVSTKYGDENLYSYFLGSPLTEWVFVSDKDKELTYEGRVQSFSEEENVRELLLIDVRVYEYESSDYLYSLKHIYLSFEQGALAIESYPTNEEISDGET